MVQYHGLCCCGCGKQCEGVNRTGSDTLPYKLWVVTPYKDKTYTRLHSFCSIKCIGEWVNRRCRCVVQSYEETTNALQKP